MVFMDHHMLLQLTLCDNDKHMWIKTIHAQHLHFNVFQHDLGHQITDWNNIGEGTNWTYYGTVAGNYVHILGGFRINFGNDESTIGVSPIQKNVSTKGLTILFIRLGCL